MLKLARYLKHFKLHVSLGPACKLIEAIFELIVPLVMADMIDNGIAKGNEGAVWQGGAKLIFFAVCGLSFTLVCQYMASVASQGVGTMLRRDLFAHVNTLSYKEIDKAGTPALVTRIANDVNQVQTAVAMLIRLVIRAPFLVIGATVMAMTIDLKLSLIFLGSMVAIILIMFPIMKITVKLFKRQQKSLDGISRITRENLSGVRVVRAFARQEHEKQRFEDSAEEYREFALRAGRINALLSPAIFIVVNAAYLLIVYLGGSMVSADGLSQGQVIALVNYMTQISLALVVVANLVTIFTKAAASSARINEVFDMKPSVVGAASMPKTDSSAPAIEFRNVSFSYLDKDGERSLENVSFALEKGDVLGIIGGTGSGKSTLVNLLSRFYDATEGKVLLYGADVRDYPDGELRRLIGIVPQKTELLSGTLRENMTMGRTDITDERIFRALEIAQAKEFTDALENGLDARVLAGGKNFSGGQKQRLAIARAIAKSPDILILDDSSSALDYATDAKLRKALKGLSGMTTVIVSQRANSIRHADKIIVLDDGKVSGIGTHAELLRECDVYREICLTQYTEDELREQEKEG